MASPRKLVANALYKKLSSNRTDQTISATALVPSLGTDIVRDVAHEAAGDVTKRLQKKFGGKVTIRVKDYGTSFNVRFSG